MSMKFSLKNGEKVRTRRCEIATATVIAAGDMVALDSGGLIIKAVDTSAAIAWCPSGHAANSGTVVEVTEGSDFTLIGTMSVVFAKAYRGLQYDLTVTSQTINQGGTTYKVVTVSPDISGGVVGVATGVEVRIAKPLF